MFSSTIIPTIGRATLSRAVHSVLEQDFDEDDFEVIVVNDSGKPLPDEDWQGSDRVRIINTNRRERSVARNTGAAIAKGKYLHFLDDDDILLPGALDAFWKLDQQQNEAIWLYGSYQAVDNDGRIVEEIYPYVTGYLFSLLVAGESLPFQVSLLRADHFFAVGGFDSSPLILGVEDRDVGRRLAPRGPVAYIPAIVARIRIGEQGSTTNWGAIAERDRWGREKALKLQDSYNHIRKSLGLCLQHDHMYRSYLAGRTLRAYIASMAWNLQHGNWMIAASRGMAGLFLTGFNILVADFWRGLRNLRPAGKVE
jgi:glycosyltransferase involved in cell wall biosynthesis